MEGYLASKSRYRTPPCRRYLAQVIWADGKACMYRITTSVLQHDGTALLPVMYAIPDIHPVAQPHRLPLRGIDVVPPKRILEDLLALPDAAVVLVAQGLEVRRHHGLLDGLVGVHDGGEQRGLVRRAEGLVVRDVDAAQAEEVLRAEERVRERAVGVVDGRRGAFRAELGGAAGGGVLVRVVRGLQAEELAPEEGGVDGEVAARGGAVGEGGGEVAVERGGLVGRGRR